MRRCPPVGPALVRHEGCAFVGWRCIIAVSSTPACFDIRARRPRGHSAVIVVSRHSPPPGVRLSASSETAARGTGSRVPPRFDACGSGRPGALSHRKSTHPANIAAGRGMQQAEIAAAGRLSPAEGSYRGNAG